MNTRRDFIKRSGLLLLSAGPLSGMLLSLEGCNPATWIAEANNIIHLIAPLGDGVAAIVEVIDPPLAIAVAAADKLYDAAVAAVEQYLTDWAAASAAAQPAILAQLQTALTTLKNDAASLVSAANVGGPLAGEVTAITSVIIAEVGAILGVIPSVKAAGGTTKSLGSAKVAWMKPPMYAAQYRSSLVKTLKTPTGNPAADTARTALAAKLTAIQFKTK